jgi:hypothetical protein
MADKIKLDKWKLFEMLGYECNHQTVRDFHNSEARVKVAIAPRRGSKSYSAAYDALTTVLQPNTITWIVGPNYALAEKEFRYIHEALVLKRDVLGLPKPKVCLTNPRSGQLYIKFAWGSIVECKTADRPDGLLGEAVDLVIYSEAAQLPRGIRERYVEPTLTTTKGREIIPTTPSVDAEWVHELYMKGMEGVRGIESFQWDVTGNPTYDLEEFEYRKELLGEDNPAFREQYLGEWTFYGGVVYPQFQEAVNVIEPFEIPASWPRIRGIDFGHRDPFVCLWAAIGPEGELYFYREYYCREGAPIKHHAAMIKEFSTNERNVMTVADPSGSQLIEDLSYEGLCAIPANNSRQAGRMRVQEFLMQTPEGVVPFSLKDKNIIDTRTKWPRMYFFSDMEETLREIRYFRWKERPEKAKAEGAKESTEGEDHAMDTMRYMCMTRPSPFHSKAYAPKNSFIGHMTKMRKDRTKGQYIGA